MVRNRVDNLTEREFLPPEVAGENSGTWNSTDEPGGHDSKRNKPVTKGQTL